jgi:TfoX/Sxy family transcriptional regulator of competence genes
MAPDEIAAGVRVALADATSVHEVKMFGGIGFMLNGNMLVAVSKRGLLARVGKDAEAEALSHPGTRIMEMRGRAMPGYVFIEPEAVTNSQIADLLVLARSFVATLPPKGKSAANRGKKK